MRLDADASILMTMQMFHARLALAKRMSLAFAAECVPAGVSRIGAKDTLADAWQRTCSAAFTAAQAIRQALSEVGDGSIRPRTMRVGDLLRAAQRGECPCVDPMAAWSSRAGPSAGGRAASKSKSSAWLSTKILRRRRVCTTCRAAAWV